VRLALRRAVDGAADPGDAAWRARARGAADAFDRAWPRPSLAAAAAAGRAYCAAPWRVLEATADLDAPWDVFMGDAARRRREFPRRCFEAAYVQLLLADVYGLDVDARAVAVAVTVGGVELDWTVGAVLDGGATAAPPPEAPDGGAYSALLVVPLGLVLAAALALAAPREPPPSPRARSRAQPRPRDHFRRSGGVEKVEP
jgi:hypothetical protein